MSARCIVLVLAAFLAAASAAGQEQPAATLGARIGELFEPWSRPGSPGVAVAVMRDRETVYRGTFGLASLTHGLPITAETRFNAGSIAKHVTAVAVLMLEAERKLSLDDEIHRYLPELPDYGAPITIRQLLQQTSGLRDYRSLMFLAGWRSGDVQTHEQALKLIFRQKALNFPTGTSFVYSNTNFVLAAEIVARVTGQPFAAWMQTNLFEPLGMSSSGIRADAAEIVPNLASSYAYLGEDRGFVEDLLASSVAGSGNLVTTLDDLLRWEDHLLTAEVGGTALLERLAEQATSPGAATGYGLGVFVGTHRGLPIVHHAGETAGNRAYLLIFPEQRVRIALLANVGSLRPEAAARAIADLVLEERFAAPPAAAAARPEPAAPLDAYVGLYELDTGVLVDVGIADGVPYLIFGGTPPRPFQPLGDHAFGTGEAGVVFRFSADAAGAITGVVLELPASRIRGRRVLPVALSQREIERYVGRYFSEDLETFYQIEAADGALVARQMRLNDVRLQPIGNDRFLEQPGAGLLVEFRRGRGDRIRGFDLSISRARNIAFERQ